jgi:hypothetical protein
MKRSLRHDAVNNQEDEDSCAYPIYNPSDAAIEKTEDKSAEDSSGQLFSQASSNNVELANKGE